MHSLEKMDFLCMIKVATGVAFRDVGDVLSHMEGIWTDEPRPEYSWITKHMKRIDPDWLDSILVDTAHMCLEELEKSGTDPLPESDKELTLTNGIDDIEKGEPYKGPTAPLACDSTAAETDRYEAVMRPDPSQGDFVQTRVKKYLKYHVTAITGHQIVLSSYVTPSNVSDTSMLPVMLGDVKKNYSQLAGRIFNADKGYDSDKNCEKLFAMDMIPNIKQRNVADGTDSTNRGKPSRKKATMIFDKDAYKQRALIEAIFGAEETKGHRLHCRLRLDDNRKRFGKMLSIAWNIRVLNRFMCAHAKGYKIPSYE